MKNRLNPLFRTFSHYWWWQWATPLKLQFLDKTLAQQILPVIPFIPKIHFPFSYMKFMRILQTFYLSTTIHLKFNFHCSKNVLETVCSTERNSNCNTFERGQILAHCSWTYSAAKWMQFRFDIMFAGVRWTIIV